jgi:POT family proton-dependent oligopeptide transporter
VGWHYGFGAAGVVMVLGLLIYLAAAVSCPPTSARPRGGEAQSGRSSRARLGLVPLPHIPDPVWHAC